MSGEFTKGTTIKPAVVGTIANPDDYNQNIAGQSKDSILGIDADGNFTDFNMGDESKGVNGTLVNIIKLREAGALKFYNASGVFINTVNLGQATNVLLGQTYLPNLITVSNGADSDHDIDFSAGNFIFSDGSGQAVITGTRTKKIDTVYGIGTGAGGLDTGTVAADTIYYMFAIYNPTTDFADGLFSLSSASPTLPSGYTKFRRIAALMTDGSANIRTGTYIHNSYNSYDFFYDVDVTDYYVSSPSTSTNTSLALSVPSVSGVIAKVMCVGRTGTSASDALDVDFGHNNQTLVADKTIEILGDASRYASIIDNIPCVDADATIKYSIFTSAVARSLAFLTKGWSESVQ